MPLKGMGTRVSKVWNEDIWRASNLNDRSPRGLLYALLRIISISASTFRKTNSGSRAADLSFSSLLGLGPLIGIAMLVATKLLGERDPNLAVDLLNRLVSFVAPQLDQYENLEKGTSVTVNPDLVRLINGFIKGAKSGTAGVVGALSLVVIVLFMFKSIEDVFNDIWGVRRGRSILMRVVFYWTILVLGGALFFLTVALMGAGAFVNVFVERLPFGAEIVGMLRWSLPSISFVLLVCVLTVFYRAIPNTRVRWGPALWGALAVALLLTANNFLQFLYLRRVLLTKSLFGSLGVIPVLMFGLYVFWMFVLIGGQISYAIQNVRARNSQLAWGGLSANVRERLSLAVLLAICRRSHAGKGPISLSELSGAVKLPAQVLNECLNRIADLGYVRTADPAAGVEAEPLYEPALPLGRITLLEFKFAAENRGTETSVDALDRIDPLVTRFSAEMERLGDHAFFHKSVEELLSGEPNSK